jgi:hypothetical protein
VGKAALEGLPRVRKVTKGWRGSREINTVYYDPELITPQRLIQALKEADTYAGRVR